jgi:hypothetical protein
MSGVTGIITDTRVAATFSTAMDPTTINERKRLRAPRLLSSQGTG